MSYPYIYFLHLLQTIAVKETVIKVVFFVSWLFIP